MPQVVEPLADLSGFPTDAQLAHYSQQDTPGDPLLPPDFDFLSMQESAANTDTATVGSLVGLTEMDDLWPDCFCGGSCCLFDLWGNNLGRIENDMNTHGWY
jgi:hypothetical protein